MYLFHFIILPHRINYKKNKIINRLISIKFKISICANVEGVTVAGNLREANEPQRII